MDNQSNALELADLLEKAPAHTLEDGTITLYLGGTVVADKVAAELRRLHEDNGRLRIVAEMSTLLLDQRSALLEALKLMLGQFTKTPSTLKDSEARIKAHAAIKQAEGEST